MLPSRLGGEDGGKIGRQAKQEADGLGAYLRHRPYARVRVIRHSAKPAVAGAIPHVQSLLAVIAEEVTNRDNKTCLLLPRKNFGSRIDEVIDFVRGAVMSAQDKEEFKKNLDRVSRSLQTTVDGRKYFVGQGKLVFKSPGRAGARHGLAPIWGDPGHDSSCVIRGRMRFGASCDPKFHYDCDIPVGGNRRYPSCHDTKNISPKKDSREHRTE